MASDDEDDTASLKSGETLQLVPADLETFDTTTCLTWIIKDFDALYETSGEDSENDYDFGHLKFFAGTNFGFKAKGELYLQKGKDNDDVGVFLQFYFLTPPKKGVKVILVSYNIELENNMGNLCDEKIVSQSHISKFDYGWGCKKFKEITALRQDYLKEGVLTMRVTVKIHGTTEDLIVDTVESYEERKKDVMKKNLAQGFGQLLLSGQFSDMIFSFPGEQDHQVEIKGHKMILSVQSPVFSAIFNTEMQEKITGKVVIDDIRPEVFKMMLEYIYTEKLNDDWILVADELIYAANKYELTALKGDLDRSILDAVNVHNVLKLRKTVKLCNLQNAKKDIELYIKDHLTEFLDILEN